MVGAAGVEAPRDQTVIEEGTVHLMGTSHTATRIEISDTVEVMIRTVNDRPTTILLTIPTPDIRPISPSIVGLRSSKIMEAMVVDTARIIEVGEGDKPLEEAIPMDNNHITLEATEVLAEEEGIMPVVAAIVEGVAVMVVMVGMVGAMVDHLRNKISLEVMVVVIMPQTTEDGDGVVGTS